MIALADAGLPADHAALVQGRPAGCSTRRSAAPATGRSAGPAWSRAAGRSSSTTTSTPTSTTPPRCVLALDRAALPAGSALMASHRAGHPVADRHAVQGRRLGRVRRRQHPPAVHPKLPFCDFGEVIDPPSADVTAHVVEALAKRGPGRHPARPPGRGLAAAGPGGDGSWFGRWGANYVYGTGAVVPALIAAGVLPGKPVIRRAVRLAGRAPERRRRLGRGPALLRAGTGPSVAADRSGPAAASSTASQTAWALMALLAAVGRGHRRRRARAIERGVRWLADTQRPDGSWDEPQFTGTGFPRRLLHQLPPVPAGVPGQRARPLPERPPAIRRLIPAPADSGRCGMTGPVTAGRRSGRRLAVCAPLRIEARAVRRGLRGHGGQGLEVLRTGWAPGGPGRRGRSGCAASDADAVAVTGTCGGLAPGLEPGDLIVATEVIGPDGRPGELPVRPAAGRRAAPGRAARARGPGRHRRPACSTRPSGRRARPRRHRRRHGVVVPARRAPPGGPPWCSGGLRHPADRPLLRPGVDDRRHRRAALAAAGRPALAAWAAATGPRQVLLAGPRSFCAGVERAIQIVERAWRTSPRRRRRTLRRDGPAESRGRSAAAPTPRSTCASRSCITRTWCPGSSSAARSSWTSSARCPTAPRWCSRPTASRPAVRAEAGRRGLATIDATCPLVAKVHAEARRFVADGYLVVLIGHAGHEEVEGTLGEAPGAMTLVQTVADVAALEPGRPRQGRLPDADHPVRRRGRGDRRRPARALPRRPRPGQRRHLLRDDEPAARGARDRRRVGRRAGRGFRQFVQLQAFGGDGRAGRNTGVPD